MAIYSYKGLSKSGKEIKANISADNINTAKQKVKALGVMLIEIKEQTSRKKEGQSGFSFSLGKKVSVQDLSIMTRQLATLIKAKIQIVEALSALTDQVESPTLRVVLSEVRQKVNEGASLAKALSDYPKIFNSVYVNMVEAGETSGTLDIVLVRLADFTESQLKLRNKIKGAMTYPVVMLVFGLIMIGVIFVTVIPKITKIFVSMKKKLPLQTEICIAISHFLQDYWYVVIAFIIATYYAFNRYIKTKKGEERWHRFLLNAPLIGEIVTMINVSRFCSTLATLLNSSVPILVSLKIVKNLIPNVHIKKAIDKARDNVQEGASMAVPLKQSKLFPPMVTHMITLGERSGELQPMLKIVAENYDDQVDSKLNGLTSTLEPLMMIGMGGLIGFVVFSVVVPLMEVNSMR